MKLNDLIKISFQNACRSKSSFLIMALMIIVSISCLFSFSYKHSFTKYWNQYINKSPEFRIMNVYYGNLLDPRITNRDPSLKYEEKMSLIEETTEKVLNILSQNEHILGASTQYRTFFTVPDLQTEETNGTIEVLGIPLVNNIPLIAGENLDQYSANEKVLICPNKLYLSSRYGNFDSTKEKDISTYVSQTIDLKVLDKYPDKYKIIGLYDTLATYSLGQICYTSYENIEEMQEIIYENDPEAKETYTEYMKTPDYMGPNIYIMIDDMKNLKEVDDFLHQQNMFEDGAIVGINTETVDQVMKVCNIITFCLFIVTGIIVSITLFQNIVKRSREIYLYRVLGYQNKDIFKMFFLENSILSLISLVFSILITQIGLKIYQSNVLLYKSRLYLMNPSVDLLSILITLLVILSIPMILTIVVFRFSKKETNFIGE